MIESSSLNLLDLLTIINYKKIQKAVLSDSGTISEESSILKFKALNLRESHERPEAMEETSVMMVGLHHERILQALHILETQTDDTLRYVADYSMPNVTRFLESLCHIQITLIKRCGKTMKFLFINSVCDYGSTGRIIRDLSVGLKEKRT